MTNELTTNDEFDELEEDVSTEPYYKQMISLPGDIQRWLRRQRRGERSRIIQDLLRERYGDQIDKLERARQARIRDASVDQLDEVLS